MAMRQVLKSRKDDFSSCSQREPFDSMEAPVSSKVEADNARQESRRSADYAIRRLALAFFRHLHDLFGRDTFYALYGDMWLKRSAVEKFSCTAPALPLLFATPGHEVAQTLQFERIATSRGEVVELDDQKDIFHAEESCGVGLRLESSPLRT